MKKYFRKILLLFILGICFCSNVYAKEGIKYINIDVYINEVGNADVTETWKCEAYSGTEWYHPYYNLGNAGVTNLSVTENNKEYTLLSYWDVSASQYDKK